MYDPNNPVQQVPGQMQIMGAPTGAPDMGAISALRGQRPMPGAGFNRPLPGAGPATPAVPGAGPSALPPTDGFAQGGLRALMGDRNFSLGGMMGGGLGGGIRDWLSERPRFREFEGDRDAFRDARQEWLMGSPFAGRFQQNGAGVSGPANPAAGILPGAPVPGAPVGQIGTGLGVDGATPPPSGFGLPGY